MKIFVSNHFIKITSIFIVTLILVTGFIYGARPQDSEKVSASTSQNVSGFAWSDNVGWISFNCKDSTAGGTHDECPANGGNADYGVHVERTLGLNFGLISGRAWSSNIGWITFESSELSGCPSAPCQARLGTDISGNLTANPNDVTGWARACGVFASGCSGTLKASTALGGFDGWISLRGSNYGIYLDPADSKLKGLAWGDLVLGWIDFNPLLTGGVLLAAPPIVGLSVDNSTPDAFTPVILTWVVSGGATECHSMGGEFGWGPLNDPKTPSGGSEMTDPITAPQNFSIQCSNAFGNSNISEVNVTPQFPLVLSLSANPASVPDLINQEVSLTWNISGATPANCILSAVPSVAEWNETISGDEVSIAGSPHTRAGVDVAKKANLRPEPTTTYKIDCGGIFKEAFVTRKWIWGDGICESVKGENAVSSPKPAGGDCPVPVYQED